MCSCSVFRIPREQPSGSSFFKKAGVISLSVCSILFRFEVPTTFANSMSNCVGWLFSVGSLVKEDTQLGLNSTPFSSFCVLTGGQLSVIGPSIDIYFMAIPSPSYVRTLFSGA